MEKTLLVNMIALFLLISFFPVENDASVCLSDNEKFLFQAVNAYRETLELEPVKFSQALTQVAQAHVRDLAENYDFKPNARCNPHGWSKKGTWSSCCYTADHKQAKCMWDKPREIANFDTNGFEILSYSSDGVTPTEALLGWQKSKAHHEVMINKGMWEKVSWGSMGVGIYEEWAVVWFATDDDPIQGTPAPCQ